jgi:hypothetical protein
MKNIKDRLERSIIKENRSLLDTKVINLSQLLDHFVYKCTFCSKNINCLTKLSLKDTITNEHLANNHFLISLYYYMFQGIKNNQMIYLSMDESMYKDLLSILKSTSFPIEHIRFRSVEEVIASNKKGGLMDLENKLRTISSEYNLKNYDGYRWISQPDFAIKNTSLNDFYNWEMNLDTALKEVNVNSSLGFVYKNYNYENKDKYFEEPVIDKTQKIDSYVVDDSLFIGLDYIFK